MWENVFLTKKQKVEFYNIFVPNHLNLSYLSTLSPLTTWAITARLIITTTAAVVSIAATVSAWFVSAILPAPAETITWWSVTLKKN